MSESTNTSWLKLPGFLGFAAGVMLAISGAAQLTPTLMLKGKASVLNGYAKQLDSLKTLPAQAKAARSEGKAIRERVDAFPKFQKAAQAEVKKFPLLIAGAKAKIAKQKAERIKLKSKASLLASQTAQLEGEVARAAVSFGHKTKLRALALQEERLQTVIKASEAASGLRKQAIALQARANELLVKASTEPGKAAAYKEQATTLQAKAKQTTEQADKVGQAGQSKQAVLWKKQAAVLQKHAGELQKLADLRSKLAKSRSVLVGWKARDLQFKASIASSERKLAALETRQKELPLALKKRGEEAKHVKSLVAAQEAKAKKLEKKYKTLSSVLPAKLKAQKLPLNSKELRAKAALWSLRAEAQDKAKGKKKGLVWLQDENNWPRSMMLFWLGVALMLIGVVVWRSALNHEVKAQLSANENSDSNPFLLLANIQAPLQKLADDIDGLSLEAICERVDEISGSYVLPFAEVRRGVVDRLGMNAGAEILVTVAYGERMLNRVWSAAADGYHPEAVKVLPEAIGAFAEAQSLAEKASS